MRNRLAIVFASIVVACGTSSSSPGGGSAGAPDAGGGTSGAPLPDAGSSGGAADAGSASGGGSGNADAGSGGTPDAGTTGGGGGVADAGASNGGGGGAADAGTVAQGPEVLTTTENAVALAIDADNVYWLNIRRVPTSDMTYQYVDVKSMPKTGGAPATLAQTSSMWAINVVAPGNGVVVWSAAACAPPCDYPGAGREAAIYTLDSSAARGYRMITGAYGRSQVAATQTLAFSRHLNGNTSQWDLTACAIDGSGCTTILSDPSMSEALYLDSGRLFWIRDVETPDSSSATLLWNDASPPYTVRGHMPFPGMDLGFRVNGDAVAVRSGAEIWTGTVGGQMTRVWVTTGGNDIDISHGRMYWNQSPFTQYEGCLGVANLDGTDGGCLDHGQHQYGTVRVDEQHVWYIRDGQIVRLSR